MLVELVGMVVARVRAPLRKSAALVVNSGALAVGTAVTAVLGFVYWWLAARLFPPEVIGRVSGLLSVMGLVGLLGEAGLGTLLIGEIARHRSKGPGLVAAAVSVGIVLGGCLGASYVLGAHLIGSTELIDGWFEGFAFVLGCVLTILGMLVDEAFVGNLNSIGRMIRQVLFSVFKLALVAAAAAVGYISNGAILLSWVAGLLASWIGYDLVSRGGVRRLFGRPDFGLLHALRHKLFGHYALDFTLQGPSVAMPYLVLVLLSPTTNAAFACLWMLVSMASVIPAVTATALFPVARANPAQSRHNILVSLTASLLFSLIFAVLVLVYSRQMLALFNPAYPEIAGSSLRFLGFSLLGLTLKFHACALARLGDWMRKAAGWFALGGLLEVSLAVAGAKLDGLQGLVLGWTLAVSIEGACVALGFGLAAKLDSACRSVRPGSAPSPLQT